jgi:hypothetical protein
VHVPGDLHELLEAGTKHKNTLLKLRSKLNKWAPASEGGIDGVDDGYGDLGGGAAATATADTESGASAVSLTLVERRVQFKIKHGGWWLPEPEPGEVDFTLASRCGFKQHMALYDFLMRLYHGTEDSSDTG